MIDLTRLQVGTHLLAIVYHTLLAVVYHTLLAIVYRTLLAIVYPTIIPKIDPTNLYKSTIYFSGENIVMSLGQPVLG